MHVFNKLFKKVYLITTDSSNERYKHFREHLKFLNYELRVSVNNSYFTDKYDGDFKINDKEQSLQSTYSTILYECYYNNIDTIVIIEDDNQFVDNFEELFMYFYRNVPDDWDFINLSSYPLGYDKNEKNYIVSKINDCVNKVKVKHCTNCTIFRKPENYKLIYDKIVSSKYPVDFVLTHFTYNIILNAYSPIEDLTTQLSTGLKEVPSGSFKSLLR